MARLTALRRPAATKHSLIQLGVLFLIVSGASWNYDAWLFVRMRIIANDAFTFGSPAAPLLLMDDGEELRAYSPMRVAEFFSCPVAQIRSVAFLSIAERGDDRDPREWIGVAPRLLQAFASESDEIAKECARSALLNLPLIPIAEVPTVVAFIESDRPNDDSLRPVRAALIAKVFFSDPERFAWVTSVYRQWMESPEFKDRREAFNQLMSLAPSSTETVAAFKALMQAGDPERVASAAGRRILRRHPNLIEECLAGNAVERRFILDCAIEETRLNANHRPNSIGETFTEAQLRCIQQLQEGLLAADGATVHDVNKACEFLRYRPRGSDILLTAVGRLSDQKRAAALRHLHGREDDRRRR